MAIVLNGASGFVGRDLAKLLLAKGEQVVLFASSMATMPGDRLVGAYLVEGDIRSGDDLRNAFQAAPIDRVVHAAAVTPGEWRGSVEGRQLCGEEERDGR